ncbi:vacuole membrane protein 1 [Tetranychus urticae]|uniref:Vacuole membrane protein 1 n=1 Tax=Tetranychus urticae TaxID=32264 RepID=T1KF28_TETUR|nr:vacuole membrane protein 1 [Tetranychus urticae]
MEIWDTKKENLVLWKKPVATIDYALRESLYLTYQCFHWLKGHLKTTLLFLLTLATLLITYSYYFEDFHSTYFNIIWKKILWSAYWIGLGILSSVGFGTGLHTFILYLGPHIAKVTLAAYECGSLSFPEPPYPDEIVCPDLPDSRPVSVWDIISKVRLEAFMWGAGTALGELPPYFMAKVKRLSGRTIEELETQELLEASKQKNGSVKNGRSKKGGGNKKNSLISRIINNISDKFDRASSWVQFLVKKVGFFGILFCASFPNPVYDLAGITCGHCLVPFWTFFGATLIGKAVIKMHIQKLFVIIAFNENLLENFVDKIKDLPVLGKYLHEPFRDFLINQKERLHGKVVNKPHWIASLFEKIVMTMIIYFLLSIINSLAQRYHSRVSKALSKSSSSSSLSSTSSKNSQFVKSSLSKSPSPSSLKAPSSPTDSSDTALNKRKKKRKSKD